MEQGNSKESFVTAVLEHDQLILAHKRPVARKRLRAAQLVVLWLLRGYLLFMIGVVLYQVWQGLR